ncbi:hypothetical protein [Streptacidiphilus sp. EB103A]|uniref:hypothetical protein n=1 Tax=Streptacidiphilus sp. EB103A TaxID=3156275 RepID=UPI003512FA4E
MQQTSTPGARIGTTGWTLSGITTSPGGTSCDHCGRLLKHLYDVVDHSTGRAMTVGRGCCKKVTGWSLSAAQAAQLLRAAASAARKEAAWNTFIHAHPEAAARITADIAHWNRTRPPALGGGPAHEVKLWITTEDPAKWAHRISRYLSHAN